VGIHRALGVIIAIERQARRKMKPLSRIPVIATFFQSLQDPVVIEVFVWQAANQIVHVRCAGSFALDVVGVAMQASV
jgi:hypothetical protein